MRIRNLALGATLATIALAGGLLRRPATAQTSISTGTPQARCTHFNDPRPRQRVTLPPKGTPGWRCKRMLMAKRDGKIFPNQPPHVGIFTPLDGLAIVIDAQSVTHVNSIPPTFLRIVPETSDPDGDSTLLTWSATAGRINDAAANVYWDLKGQPPGDYTITASADDGCGCIAFTSATITLTYQAAP